jgi:hypothetical protein
MPCHWCLGAAAMEERKMKLRAVIKGPNTPGGEGIWLLDKDDLVRFTIPVRGTNVSDVQIRAVVVALISGVDEVIEVPSMEPATAHSL